MGGLALGSWGAGKIGRRKPLLIYGLVELLIGLYAFLAYNAFLQSDQIYKQYYNYFHSSTISLVGIRFAIATILLAVPTLLMGATLPLLAQGTAGEFSKIGRVVARLYAINTLGAVAGTLITGFILIPDVGLLQTNHFAVALNILIGLAAIALSFPLTQKMKDETPAPRERSDKRVLLAAFSTGFVALALEVLWVRSLIFTMFLGSSTYAVATIVGTFLMGISLGAFLCSRFLVRSFRSSWWFMLFETIIGVGSFISGLLLIMGYITPTITIDFGTGVLTDFGRILLLLVLPATMMGAAFTTLLHIAIRDKGHIATDVSHLYSINTLGAILGSFASGFLLIPVFGIARSLALLSALSILIGIAFHSSLGAMNRKVLFATILVLLPSAVLFDGSFKRYFERTGDKILFYDEGAAATVTVTRATDKAKYLYVDSTFVQGSNFMLASIDYKMQAHLPMLFAAHPRDICTIGFGTGGTTYSYSKYSNLRNLTCVEIDKNILKTAPFFDESNHGILTRNDPRIQFVFDDAQSYLMNSGRKFDAISVDLTDIAYKSSSALYSVDFLKECRKSLNPGGINTIWLSVKSLSLENLKILLKTIISAYDPRFVSLWHMTSYPNHDLLLVAVKDRPLTINFDVLTQRLSENQVNRDLSEIYLNDPYKLLSSYFLPATDLGEYLRDVPVHSLDMPILEFSAPKDRFRTLTTWQNIGALYWHIRNPFPPLIANQQVHDRLRSYIYAREFFFQGETSTLQKSNLLAGARAFQHAHFLLPGDQSLVYCLNSTDSQIASFETNHLRNPHDENNLILLLSAYVMRENWEKANQLIQGSESSSNPVLLYLQGRVSEGLGAHDKARNLYTRFLPYGTEEYAAEINARMKAWDLEDRSNLTSDEARELVEAYLDAGEYSKAVNRAELLSATSKEDVQLWLVSIYRAAGLFEKAVTQLKQIVQVKSGNAEAWYYLGDLQLQLRDMQNARQSLEKALSLNERVPPVYYSLAKYYEIMDMKDQATRFLLRAIELGGGQLREIAASDPIFRYRFSHSQEVAK